MKRDEKLSEFKMIIKEIAKICNVSDEEQNALFQKLEEVKALNK